MAPGIAEGEWGKEETADFKQQCIGLLQYTV